MQIITWILIKVFLLPANKVWGKVIFSQASVIQFTGGVQAWGWGMCAQEGVSMPEGGHACLGDTSAQGVCGPGEHACLGACMKEGVCMPGGMHSQGVCVAGETATAVGGTHPTGMHSCRIYYSNWAYFTWKELEWQKQSVFLEFNASKIKWSSQGWSWKFSALTTFNQHKLVLYGYVIMADYGSTG